MNLDSILIGLSYASLASSVASIVLYFLAARYDPLRQAVVIFLTLSLAADIGTRIYIQLGYQGHLLANLYTAAECGLLCYVFAKLLKPKKLSRLILILCPILCLSSVFAKPIDDQQSLPSVIESLIMVGLSCWYYLKMYRHPTIENLFTFFPAWLVAAIFFYFAFDLYLFATAKYVFRNPSAGTSHIIWAWFRSFNCIARASLIACGFYFGRESSESEIKPQPSHLHL